MNDLKSNEEIKVCKLKNNTKTEMLDNFLIVMVKGFGVTIGLILGAYVGSESVNYLYDSKLHNIEETVEEHMMLDNHTERQGQINTLKIDEQISNIEQNFIKEKTDMEKMLEENIISENEAMMIITHMEDMKNKEIAKIVNEDAGYEKITTNSMTANALNVSLKGGDIIQVILSPDEEIVEKFDAHLKLKDVGYAGIEFEDIDYIDTTILVDTTGNGFDVSGYATRVIK